MLLSSRSVQSRSDRSQSPTVEAELHAEEWLFSVHDADLPDTESLQSSWAILGTIFGEIEVICAF